MLCIQNFQKYTRFIWSLLVLREFSDISTTMIGFYPFPKSYIMCIKLILNAGERNKTVLGQDVL